MPRISVNAGPAGQAWTPLPKGDYLLQVEDATEQANAGAGSIKLACVVIDGAYENKKATVFLSLHENAAWRMRGFVEAVLPPDKYTLTPTGQTNDRGEEISTVEFDSDDLLGQQFLARCSIREYNGKDQNEFDNFRNPDAEESAAEEPPMRSAAPAASGRTAAAPAAKAPATRAAAAPAAAPARERRRIG